MIVKTSTSTTSMPRTIWALGFVSLLMDVSSEMIHSLLPVFMATTLGVGMLWIGLIEGIAEATALIVRVFSGTLSDWWGRRKPLALLGYGMGAISKPLFALATGTALIVTARFIDRLGKGIRGAPRDALVADLAPPGLRGAAFGLRQSLDTWGAFAGPLIAAGLMLLWANDFRAVFWAAVIPGSLAVLLLATAVKEPERTKPAQQLNPISRASLARLSGVYWKVVALGGIFMLARFSEAFLLLRAENLGIPVAAIPIVLVAMNAVYAVTAYPAGTLSDSMPRSRILGLGLVVLMAADVMLAIASGWGKLAAGVFLWGLHMGLTQGLLAAMVADTAPEDLRGTAFGCFNLVSGLALLLASTLAGGLWAWVGPVATFWAGAVVALLTLAALPLLSPTNSASS